MSLLGLIALALSIIAFRRTDALAALQRRITELETEMAALRRLSPQPAEAPTEAESPTEEETHLPELPPTAPTSPTREDEPAPVLAPRLPPPAPPTIPPPAPRPTIDWERWVGVQGAAVLGGVVLALAGLLFFKYSIEHGLISPTLRVILGTLIGLTCVIAPERRWRRSYPDAANALSGAGVVILYGAFWAAHSLYGLVGSVPAFVLMALVTAAGCVLAIRHNTLLIAVLGLVGGFATPFLLASNVDRPVGLFGYILLLDIALMAVARHRSWPILGLASLIGTVLYQASWIGLRMSPSWSIFALAMLGSFALLFALGAPRDEGKERETWFATQASAILLPFAFGIYLVGNARLGPHLYPLAFLLVLLSAAAAWIGRQQQRPWLGLGAASGGVAVLAVAIVTRPTTIANAWESAVVAFAIALVFHLFAERDGESGMEGAAPAAIVSAGGLLLVTIAGALMPPGCAPWPWIVAWLALAGLLIRNGTFAGREFLQPMAATGVALGLTLVRHDAAPFFPAPVTYLTVLLVVAILFQLAALVQTPSLARRRGEESAALIAVLLLLSLAGLALPAQVFLAGAFGFGFLAALAATRMGSGWWYLAAVVGTALLHTVWTWIDAEAARRAATGLLLTASAAVFFTAWPFLTVRRFRADMAAWWASALAGPLWFLALHTLFQWRFGGDWIGVLPLALGAVALIAADRARSLATAPDPMRKSALVWFCAVALGFVSVAIPLQLSREWITIGWALESLAVTLLWRRLDHPGLKYFALALIVGVTVRLVGNEAVLGYYPRSAWRIVNWLLYTYGVPAVAFIGVSSVLAESELARLRAWEGNPLAPISERRVPLVATAAGLAAILIVFVWINLAIADWFSEGPMLQLAFDRMPARDLTTSLAWAVYALLLLGLGMVRGTSGLRWLSLGFLVLTIGKVFLYDLGTLRDLYRVMSLLGLAVSLILVSLAYQRFVFRRSSEEDA